jgi:hypothetical protein
MDETTKARLIALASLPLAQLSLVDIGFLVATLDAHPDDVVALVPELAALLDL